MESEEQINREPEAPTGPGPTEQDDQQDLPPGYAERDDSTTSDETGAGEDSQNSGEGASAAY